MSKKAVPRINRSSGAGSIYGSLRSYTRVCSMFIGKDFKEYGTERERPHRFEKVIPEVVTIPEALPDTSPQLTIWD
jgi:hypothetical protein